jgi:hypothetical protein
VVLSYQPGLTVVDGQSQTLLNTIDIIINNVTIVDVVEEKIFELGTIHVNKGKIIGLSSSGKVVAHQIVSEWIQSKKKNYTAFHSNVFILAKSRNMVQHSNRDVLTTPSERYRI